MRRSIGLFVLTLIALPLVRAEGPARGDEATIAFLKDLQTADGGFLPAPARPGRDNKASLRATSAALRALKYFGGKPRDEQGARRFVLACFDKGSGGFADTPGGQPEVALTAVGLMAAVEQKVATEPMREAAARYLEANAKNFEEVRIAAAGFESLGTKPTNVGEWQKQVVALRNPDGSFGKGDGAARATGGAVAAILRLGGDVGDRDAVLKVLNSGQRPDGGYGKEGTTGSDLETTYRVLRSYVMLKSRPADAGKVRTFVARCRNADGGYGVAPGQPSAVGPTYYAGIVLHWLTEK